MFNLTLGASAMTTAVRMYILGQLADLSDKAVALTNDVALEELRPTGSKVSGQVSGTIKGWPVSVRYTWSRRYDGRGLERWTYYLDGKRLSLDDICNILEQQIQAN